MISIFCIAYTSKQIIDRLDYRNTRRPAWGVKTLTPLLTKEGFKVRHELVCARRAAMGLETIYSEQNM